MVRHWRASSAVLVLVQDEHQRPGVVDQPAQPAGERRPQRDRQRPGDVAGRERGDRAGVDHQPATGQVLLDPVGRQQGQDPPVGAEQLGADPVALPQPQEVRRVAAEAGQQLGTKASSSGRPGAGCGGVRPRWWSSARPRPGRRRTSPRRGSGTRPARRAATEPLVQGPVGGPGQRLGQLRPARSVRATVPTSSAPPLNRASGRRPSSSR